MLKLKKAKALAVVALAVAAAKAALEAKAVSSDGGVMFLSPTVLLLGIGGVFQKLDKDVTKTR